MPKRIPTPLRWLLGIALTLALLVVGFYQLASWSGARAWKSAVADYEAAGGSLDFDFLLPAPIPADQNYAAIPALYGLTADATSIPLTDALSLQDVFRDGAGDSYEAKVGEKQFQFKPLTFGAAHASGAPIDLRIWASELISKNDSESVTKGDPAPPGTADYESPADAAAAILQILDSHFADVFSQSDKAASRPSARWLPLISESFDRKTPISNPSWHSEAASNLERILALRAFAAVHADKPAIAHTSILAILHLANAERPFATGLSSFPRSSSFYPHIFAATSEALAKRLFDRATLADLQHRLAKIDTLTHYAAALRMEIISTTQSLAAFNRGEFDDIDLYFSYGLGLPNALYPSGWIDQTRAIFLREIHETAIIPLEKRDIPLLQTRQAELRAWMDEITKSRLARIRYRPLLCLLPDYDYFNVFVTHAQAVANQAQTACALERHFLKHGIYPENLDSLIPEFLQRVPEDPIDRQPLRYRRTPKDGRYLLYSIGWNQKDENATPAWNPTYFDQIDRRKGDWIWSYIKRSADIPVR